MKETEQYTLRKWYHWFNLNWILNPGLALNELILGQRIAAKVSIDKYDSDKKYVKCPHCGEMHDLYLWNTYSPYRNWFGLYCPSCTLTIPCTRNATSLLITFLTLPLWIWFYKSWKTRWLLHQAQIFSEIKKTEDDYDNFSIFIPGFSLSGIMVIVSTILYPILHGDTINGLMTLIAIPAWIIGGLCFGYILWHIRLLKRNKIR